MSSRELTLYFVSAVEGLLDATAQPGAGTGTDHQDQGADDGQSKKRSHGVVVSNDGLQIKPIIYSSFSYLQY